MTTTSIKDVATTVGTLYWQICSILQCFGNTMSNAESSLQANVGAGFADILAVPITTIMTVGTDIEEVVPNDSVDLAKLQIASYVSAWLALTDPNFQILQGYRNTNPVPNQTPDAWGFTVNQYLDSINTYYNTQLWKNFNPVSQTDNYNAYFLGWALNLQTVLGTTFLALIADYQAATKKAS